MFGKVLGALVGLAIGLAFHSFAAAVLFAILGGLIGHVVDALHAEVVDDLPPRRPISEVPIRAPDPELERAAEAQAAFSRHLCSLFVEVARADGEVVRDEVRVVREYFEKELRLGGRSLQRVRNQLKAAIASPQDLEAAALACRDELADSARLLLLNALYEMALADGELRKSEREAIRRVAQVLEISDEEHRSITSLHFGDGADAYAVLGVDPSVGDDELKSAFRRLAALHHPDKVAHLGAGASEVATRRFQEIQDAYEEIRRLRNL